MAVEVEAPLLAVSGLYAVYDSARGPVHALNGVSFTVRRGEVLALVATTEAYARGRLRTALARRRAPATT